MKNSLYAGFARAEMTPPLGINLAGFGRPRPALGVIDPLFINVLILSDGDKKAAVVVLDICGVPEDVEEWISYIAEKSGIPAAGISMVATHTHYGPSVNASPLSHPVGDEKYNQWLMEKIVETVKSAEDDLKEVVSVRHGETTVPDTTYPRRWKLKDGTYDTHLDTVPRDFAEGPACVNDETLRLIRLVRSEGEDIVLLNFATHPCNLRTCAMYMGGSMITADYPGVLRKRFEELIPSSHCIHFTGFAGQLIGFDERKPKESVYGYDLSIINRAGENLAKAAVSLYNQAIETEKTGFTYCKEYVPVKTKMADLPMEECREIIDLMENGKEDIIRERYHIGRPQRKLSEARRVLRLYAKKEYEKLLPVTAICFGGVSMLCLPGEPFCEFGIDIRKNSPFDCTFTCEYTNAAPGYIPTEEAYEQGGYEPLATCLAKGSGEILRDAAKDVLKKCKAEMD